MLSAGHGLSFALSAYLTQRLFCSNPDPWRHLLCGFAHIVGWIALGSLDSLLLVYYAGVFGWSFNLDASRLKKCSNLTFDIVREPCFLSLVGICLLRISRPLEILFLLAVVVVAAFAANQYVSGKVEGERPVAVCEQLDPGQVKHTYSFKHTPLSTPPVVLAAFDDGRPLTGASPVDMWSDPNFPVGVTRSEWDAVRDGLHNKGNALKRAPGGPSSEKVIIGSLVYRSSLALNAMQHRYKTDLFVVGGQGRLLVERATSVFIPGLAASETAARLKDTNFRGLELAKKLAVMKSENHASKAVIDACHALRMFGNRTDHDSLPDLKPEDKPDVIKNAVVVAKALLWEAQRLK